MDQFVALKFTCKFKRNIKLHSLPSSCDIQDVIKAVRLQVFALFSYWQLDHIAVLATILRFNIYPSRRVNNQRQTYFDIVNLLTLAHRPLKPDVCMFVLRHYNVHSRFIDSSRQGALSRYPLRIHLGSTSGETFDYFNIRCLVGNPFLYWYI